MASAARRSKLRPMGKKKKAKIGRPPKDNRDLVRDKKIEIDVTAAERDWVSEQAASARKRGKPFESRAAWIRFMIGLPDEPSDDMEVPL